jgi:hypothetical protein
MSATSKRVSKISDTQAGEELERLLPRLRAQGADGTGIGEELCQRFTAAARNDLVDRLARALEKRVPPPPPDTLLDFLRAVREGVGVKPEILERHVRGVIRAAQASSEQDGPGLAADLLLDLLQPPAAKEAEGGELRLPETDLRRFARVADSMGPILARVLERAGQKKLLSVRFLGRWSRVLFPLIGPRAGRAGLQNAAAVAILDHLAGMDPALIPEELLLVCPRLLALAGPEATERFVKSPPGRIANDLVPPRAAVAGTSPTQPGVIAPPDATGAPSSSPTLTVPGGASSTDFTPSQSEAQGTTHEVSGTAALPGTATVTLSSPAALGPQSMTVTNPASMQATVPGASTCVTDAVTPPRTGATTSLPRSIPSQDSKPPEETGTARKPAPKSATSREPAEEEWEPSQKEFLTMIFNFLRSESRKLKELRGQFESAQARLRDVETRLSAAQEDKGRAAARQRELEDQLQKLTIRHAEDVERLNGELLEIHEEVELLRPYRQRAAEMEQQLAEVIRERDRWEQESRLSQNETASRVKHTAEQQQEQLKGQLARPLRNLRDHVQQLVEASQNDGRVYRMAVAFDSLHRKLLRILQEPESERLPQQMLERPPGEEGESP